MGLATQLISCTHLCAFTCRICVISRRPLHLPTPFPFPRLFFYTAALHPLPPPAPGPARTLARCGVVGTSTLLLVAIVHTSLCIRPAFVNVTPP
jgi:hypothetical protein